jgi:hypothetical protein
VEDVGAFVEACGHGPEVLQHVNRPLHFVPEFVDRLVEADGPSAPAAASFAVGALISGFGNGVLDLATSQVAAVAPGGMRLSPPRWSDRVRGCPPPGRWTRMRSMTGMSCGVSSHCPGVISSASGRRPPSPDRWILQVRPPRERPSPSSGRWSRGVLLFRHPRRSPARSRRMLMTPARRGVQAHHRPVDTALGISVDQHGREDLVPRAIRRPPPVPLVDGLPRTETHRQIDREPQCAVDTGCR